MAFTCSFLNRKDLFLGFAICYTLFMDTSKRRKKIIEKLNASNAPLSASTLAKAFSVSRQIIVGDIALLRAEGNNIISTPRGYIIKENDFSFPFVGIIACKHTQAQLKDELYTIVDCGGVIIDVAIEHNIYGELIGKLNLSSRHEVDLFLESVNDENSRPLSTLSGGIHLHHIGCKDEEIFALIKEKLTALGILLPIS